MQHSASTVTFRKKIKAFLGKIFFLKFKQIFLMRKNIYNVFQAHILLVKQVRSKNARLHNNLVGSHPIKLAQSKLRVTIKKINNKNFVFDFC